MRRETRADVGTQRRARRERCKTQAGVDTEAGARKSEGKRGEKHRREPRVQEDVERRLQAREREHERREAITNASSDGIERYRWCARNVSVAGAERRS